MTGDDHPSPGNSFRQVTFFAWSHSVGRFWLSAWPCPVGPRNWCQSAPATSVMVSVKQRPRHKRGMKVSGGEEEGRVMIAAKRQKSHKKSHTKPDPPGFAWLFLWLLCLFAAPFLIHAPRRTWATRSNSPTTASSRGASFSYVAASVTRAISTRAGA